MNQNELELRLIEFAVRIITLCDNLPNTRSGNVLGNQLVRSGTSPALNYGEARGAESDNDFLHKINIVLKELRESRIALIIIEKAGLLHDKPILEFLIKESNELISIFVATSKKLKGKR
jgi:four helix bundle protein